jgi:hypothetical protein
MADIEEKPKDLESSMDISEDTEKSPEKEWAPIRPQDSRSRDTRSKPASRASSTHSISRTRSHNYFSCDEHDDTDVGDAEQGAAGKDPFEVGWENGEKDPLNPRSKRKIAKWAIVLICSLASLCVYDHQLCYVLQCAAANYIAGLVPPLFIHRHIPRLPSNLIAHK